MVEPRTFRLLDARIAERGRAVYAHVKRGAVRHPVSWHDLRRAYLTTAHRLRALHAARPVVAILADTCLEWNICDLATLALGGVVVGVYANDRDEVVRHILATSQPTIVAVQNAAMLARLQRIDPAWGVDRPAIIMQGIAERAPQLHLLTAWLAAPLTAYEETAVLHALQRLSPDDVASHVYTSGTSGLPRAAVLTQANLLHTAEVYARYYPVDARDSALLFLPFAHVFSRVMYYAGLLWGLQLHYAQSIDDVASDLVAVRPSVLLVVPRILERVRDKTLASVRASGAIARAVFRWSTAIARRFFVDGKRDLWTRLGLRVARALVIAPMQRRFGGRVRFMGCGGGKLPVEVAQFFRGFDLPIYEGYATTESGGLGVFNHPGAWRPGAVGRPVHELELRLASDGEVLMRSPSVFAGYLDDPRATRDALDDGWLATGDIGRFDADGYLEIVDRKKDIVATANGKKVAPAWIEAVLAEQPAIAQAVVFGEGRPYLVALIVAAAGHPAGALATAIDAANRALARHEQIRRFHIIPELALGTAAVTATLKLRRQAIHGMYRDEIERMYAQENPCLPSSRHSTSLAS